jgi:hypothetical protein
MLNAEEERLAVGATTLTPCAAISTATCPWYPPEGLARIASADQHLRVVAVGDVVLVDAGLQLAESVTGRRHPRTPGPRQQSRAAKERRDRRGAQPAFEDFAPRFWARR